MWRFRSVSVKKFFRLCITGVSVGVWASGCGNAPKSTVSVATGQPKALAIFGGFNTCVKGSPIGMGMYKPFLALRDVIATKSGSQPKTVMSCYDFSTKVHYVRSVDGEAIAGSEEDVFQTVKEELTGYDVVAIGHSYGGWMAMQSVLRYANDINFAQIHTIDPISRERCHFIGNPGNCIEAPPDISDEQRTQIRNSVSDWRNFYQRQTFYLHSSPISQANQNKRVDASHTSIDDYPEVWQSITQAVDSDDLISMR